MNTKNLLFLGAGLAAGRMLKKKANSGPVLGIGAISRFQIVRNPNWIKARKKDAKFYLESFKWDDNTKKILESIKNKGYIIDENGIKSVMIPLTGRKRFNKSSISFFYV
jgi:hypothetical protein